MSNYRFDPLSDREFEEFCCDVLSRYLSVRIELFKSGKDSGIDGRFFSCGDVCIIQCKRYVVSQYNSLLRNLKKEVPKVKKLSPQRYILATACELSPANKKEIFDLFTPYIQNEADIFSAQDLLSFLDKPDYDDILKTHYKLWLTSTAVLNKIFNNAIIGRSQSELEIIIKDSSKYILTDDFNHALDRLKETHTAILTGAPGIGKTTLARLLAMHYVTHQDFEFYIIYEDISEIEAVWRHDRKQLFYFDDFLGKNYLEAVEKNLDTHIMSFINRVKNADNKRFILTSRTHIINRGLFLSQVFQDGNLQRNEYEVKLENLSQLSAGDGVLEPLNLPDTLRRFFTPAPERRQSEVPQTTVPQSLPKPPSVIEKKPPPVEPRRSTPAEWEQRKALHSGVILARSPRVPDLITLLMPNYRDLAQRHRRIAAERYRGKIRNYPVSDEFIPPEYLVSPEWKKIYVERHRGSYENYCRYIDSLPEYERLVCTLILYSNIVGELQ